LETFLDAAAILTSQGKAVRLRVVGPFESTEYEREIRDRTDKLGLADRIEWRGFQERVDLELDQMDLLVFPSVLPEGMPMVLLEAMAAGVPIVASRVNGITDVLREREDGLLFTPGDSAELAAGVTQVIEWPTLAHRLRDAAFVRQREHFSDHSMAAAVAKIYQHVLTPKGIAT
jgi:glycosyltransferase involved in cell wall biosynthesis